MSIAAIRQRIGLASRPQISSPVNLFKLFLNMRVRSFGSPHLPDPERIIRTRAPRALLEERP